MSEPIREGDLIREERERRRIERRRQQQRKQAATKSVRHGRGKIRQLPVVELTDREQKLAREWEDGS